MYDDTNLSALPLSWRSGLSHDHSYITSTLIWVQEIKSAIIEVTTILNNISFYWSLFSVRPKVNLLSHLKVFFVFVAEIHFRKPVATMTTMGMELYLSSFLNLFWVENGMPISFLPTTSLQPLSFSIIIYMRHTIETHETFFFFLFFFFRYRWLVNTLLISIS